MQRTAQVMDMKTEHATHQAARFLVCCSIATVLITTGCMVGPNYKPPATTMPAAYREATTASTTAPTSFDAESSSDVRWWRQFDDPQLTDLVEKSVKANYSIAVAEARVREAREERRIVQSLLYPQASVGGSVLRFRAPEAVIGIPGADLEDNLFTLGFDASWVVDVFGQARRGVEAAKANEQASAAERRGAVLMVAAETARGYLELRGAQRELAIAQDTLTQQRHTLELTENKRQNGLASNLEVLRARTEVESTAAQVPPLQQAVRQYIHVLSTLLGLEPTALADQLERPMRIPSSDRQLTVGIPSDLLRRRPDIQASERQLAAATAGIGVETAQLFPQLVLGGSAGLQSRHWGDLFNGNSTRNGSSYYVAGPAINWTVFDAGRRKAQIKLAEAQVDAAKASYEDTVLRAFREVESSLVAVDRGNEQVGDLQRLSATARESVDVARRDYERGLLDQLTVLDAQRQSNRADMMLAQSQVQLAVNVVTLYKALGGGWEIAEPSPSTRSVAISTQHGAMR